MLAESMKLGRDLHQCMEAALTHQALIAGIYEALDEFRGITQEHQRGISEVLEITRPDGSLILIVRRRAS